MIRAFLAVLLDDALRTSLQSLQDSLRKRIAAHHDPSMRVQWTRPDSLHLTLKFLGDIEAEQVEPIREVVGPVIEQAHALTVSFTQLGAFPDPKAPRVLWVGARPSASVNDLVALATAVDQALAALGFEAERRPFQPHLTLARIKDGGRPFGQALLRSGLLDHDVDVGSLSIRHVHLMKSELRPAGAVYAPIWSFPLRSAPSR